MPLVQRSISAKLTAINQFNMHNSVLLQTNEFCGVTPKRGGDFSRYNRKLAEPWLLHNTPSHYNCIYTMRDSSHFHASIYCH